MDSGFYASLEAEIMHIVYIYYIILYYFILYIYIGTKLFLLISIYIYYIC